MHITLPTGLYWLLSINSNHQLGCVFVKPSVFIWLTIILGFHVKGKAMNKSDFHYSTYELKAMQVNVNYTVTFARAGRSVRPCTMSGHNRSLNPTSRVKRVTRSINYKNPGNNSLICPYVCIVSRQIAVPIQYSLIFFSVSPNFPGNHSERSLLRTYLNMPQCLWFRPEHAWNICHWS